MKFIKCKKKIFGFIFALLTLITISFATIHINNVKSKEISSTKLLISTSLAIETKKVEMSIIDNVTNDAAIYFNKNEPNIDEIISFEETSDSQAFSDISLAIIIPICVIVILTIVGLIIAIIVYKKRKKEK